MAEQERRLRACVERWPEAETGAYDPACCRFPKSCSASVTRGAGEEDLEPLPPVDRSSHVRHMVLAAVTRAVEVGRDTPSLEARQAAVDAIVDSTVRALADAPEPVYGTPPPAEPVRADDRLQARVAALNAAARIVGASIGRAVPEREVYPYPYSTGVAGTVTGLADTFLRWVAPDRTEDSRG